MKCLRAIVPLEVATAGGEAATDQEMAHLLLAEEGLEPLRSQPSRVVPSPFFLPLGGATGAPPPGEVLSWVPTWVMGATFAPSPGEQPETYARERNPGRGSATGSRKVVPPAGPSHLTPSRPGEAKSRSDEAPRCPN